MFSTPSPTPVPVVPTPVVNVHVTVPPASIHIPTSNPWPAATTAVLVALLAGLLALLNARHARHEERRNAVGLAFLDSVMRLRLALPGEAKALKAARNDFFLQGPRLVGAYGRYRRHRRFIRWLDQEIQRLLPEFAEAYDQSIRLNGIDRSFLGGLLDDLARLQRSTMNWLVHSPRRWRLATVLPGQAAKEQSVAIGTPPEAIDDRLGV